MFQTFHYVYPEPAAIVRGLQVISDYLKIEALCITHFSYMVQRHHFKGSCWLLKEWTYETFHQVCANVCTGCRALTAGNVV